MLTRLLWTPSVHTLLVFPQTDSTWGRGGQAVAPPTSFQPTCCTNRKVSSTQWATANLKEDSTDPSATTLQWTVPMITGDRISLRHCYQSLKDLEKYFKCQKMKMEMVCLKDKSKIVGTSIFPTSQLTLRVCILKVINFTESLFHHGIFNHLWFYICYTTSGNMEGFLCSVLLL